MNKKITAVAIAGAILLSGCSAKYQWTKHDRQAAMVMIAGNVADGAVTSWGLRQDDISESNGLIGDNPSVGDVLLFKGATVAAFLALAHVIPKYRTTILYTVGGCMFGVAGLNVLTIRR